MLTLLLLLLLKRVDVTDTVVNAETREGAIKSQRSEDSSGEKNAITKKKGVIIIRRRRLSHCHRIDHRLWAVACMPSLEPRGVEVLIAWW
jgi:hypothetical protein